MGLLVCVLSLFNIANVVSYFLRIFIKLILKPYSRWGLSQDDTEIGLLSPDKFIKRSFEYGATSTEQLMNAGRGHQTLRKAAQTLQKEVGQNIKGENRTKGIRDRDPSWGGSSDRGDISTQQETPLTGVSVGSLDISEGNITKKKKKHPQNAPNRNYQWRSSSSDAHICQQQVGAGQEGEDCTIHP